MEARFGRIGAGARTLRINGVPLTPAELMDRLGVAADGCRGIDAMALGGGRFAVRYLDADDHCIVAYEFDSAFRYLGEMRVHVAEWVGEAHAWISS